MSDEVTYPVKLEAWRTSDGRLHDDEWNADQHEHHLRKCRLSTELLDEGKNLAEVLEATGEMRHWEAHRAVLSRITKDTGLIVSHWACTDYHAFSVCRREKSGKFYVFGDTGTWAGYYGNEMGLTDLIHHANDTMKRYGGVLPPIWNRPSKESP